MITAQDVAKIHPCPKCAGSGKFLVRGVQRGICFACNGTGRILPSGASYGVFPVVDSPMRKALEEGVAKSKAKLTLKTKIFSFSLAPKTGRNPESIYVKASDSENYLGKIQTDGIFYATAHFSRFSILELQAVLSEPLKAALTYGKETGQCSICHRTLTNPVSIAHGIGPICAGNVGWVFEIEALLTPEEIKAIMESGE